MSEPRRWVLTADNLILIAIGGPNVSISEAEMGIPVIEAEPILARIKALEAQLEEANEVARFYALGDHYLEKFKSGSVIGHDCGERAHAYLHKWRGKK